ISQRGTANGRPAMTAAGCPTFRTLSSRQGRMAGAYSDTICTNRSSLMTVTLHFHGAAGTVTGSCYRVVHPGGQFLVDCGLFPGNNSVRDLNLKPTPFDPGAIDFLLLTHGHIDHAGVLPKLYREGWRGPMWMTEPTAGLLEYLLPDSAGIQESEAERESKK